MSEGSGQDIDPVVRKGMAYYDPEGSVFTDKPVEQSDANTPFKQVPGLRADSPYAGKVSQAVENRPKGAQRYSLPSDQMSGNIPVDSFRIGASSTAFTERSASAKSEELQ